MAADLEKMSLDELQALREKLDAEMRAKQLEAAREYAVAAADALEWLHRNGTLAPAVAEAVGAGGRKPVDPDALLSGKQKKTRAPRKKRAPNLRRDPETGELYRPGGG